MSGVADDGAARLDDVLRKHQVGPSAGVARTSSRIRSSPSQDVDGDNLQQASPSSQVQATIATDQAGTRQASKRFEDLDSSGVESALKDKAYRLAGAWEQGATKLSAHLQDALAELQGVKQQENDLLQRRTDLCCSELNDQIAGLAREFQQKAEACKQEMLARIADQRAECELAIRAKAESLMGMLEEVDGVPCASGDHRTIAVANASTDRVHRLAEHPGRSVAGCPCCSEDERMQQLTKAAELYPAHRPVHRRLEYTTLSTGQHRAVSEAMTPYNTDSRYSKQGVEWWKPSASTVSPDRKRIPDMGTHNPGLSPAHERIGSIGSIGTLGVTFRRYKPCNCRARSGMIAPRAPLRLSHLLDHSDEE